MNDKQSSTQEAETSIKKLKALAWCSILIVTVPQIIYRLLVPRAPGELYNPLWLAGTEVAIIAMLYLITWVWTTVKPLRGFVLALLAFYIGYIFIIPYTHKIISQFNWIQEASWGVKAVVNRLEVHLVQIVLLVLTLIGSGIGRRELFLVRGNPGARFRRGRTADEKLPSWPRFVRSFLPFFILSLIIMVALQFRPSMSQLYNVLVFFPVIIIASVINAFGEEFEYRSVLLARLEPVLGSQSAIWISTALFGLNHYYSSIPSGPLGVILSGFLGWLLAKSMIETRGIVWAFLIHFIADFVIWCGIATLA